jgi:parallel beta-helix repeat protein
MQRSAIKQFFIDIRDLLCLHTARRKVRRAHLELQRLEERCVPATWMVINTLDDEEGSLRWVIGKANADTDAAPKIIFKIGNGGTKEIDLKSALPAITKAITIDGSTQDATSTVPPIILDGLQAGKGAAGLKVQAGNSTIIGLQIWNFSGNGVELLGDGGDTVKWCYVGTDGTLKAPNNNGLYIDSSHNRVLPLDGDRTNVISGNRLSGVLITNINSPKGVTDNWIRGCYIGVDATGNNGLGNGLDGVTIEDKQGITDPTKDGSNIIFENVISGNAAHGVSILASDKNEVEGNLIGTNSAAQIKNGVKAIGNGQVGVLITSFERKTGKSWGPASENYVAHNLVSANASAGIWIEGDPNLDVTTGNSKLTQNWIGTDVDRQVALGNKGDGIRIVNSSDNVIDGLNLGLGGGVIVDSGGWGIRITGGSDNKILGTFIGGLAKDKPFPNAGGGISLEKTTKARVGGNTDAPGTYPGNVILHKKGTEGLHREQDTSTQDRGNIIEEAKKPDEMEPPPAEDAPSVELIDSFDGTTDNDIIGNGMIIRGAGSTENIISRNYIGVDVDGSSLGNTYDGILFDESASANSVLTNTISRNAGAGIRIASGSNNLLSSNTISLNTGPGVEVDGGTATQISENTLDWLEVNGGELQVIGPSPVATFDQSGGSTTVPSTLTSSGDVQITGGTLTVVGLGAAASAAGVTTIAGGSVTLNLGGSFTASGTFQQSAGSILVTEGGSVLTLPAGATVSGGSWTVQHGGLVSDPGSFQQSGGGIAVQDSGSAFTIGGAFSQSGGSALTAGSLAVTGSVVLSGSAILSIQQGSLTAGGGLLIQSTAVLNGWGGTVYGDVTNAGTLNLIQDSTPTTLQINGNYTQTGTLNAGLGGTPGTLGNAGFSALWVSGLATLGGTFNFISLNGFAPWPTENFTVLTWGSRQGTFDAMYLPPVSAGSWYVLYDDPQHRLTLWVVG